MHFDLLIVGGGPAGLAAAIRAKQAAQEAHREIQVCVIDKGAEIGAHILSGAVIDPWPLDTLLPEWRSSAPLNTQVANDELLWLTERRSIQIPAWARPACLNSRGLYLGSLGQLSRWLAQQAEALGVEIYTGIAAESVLYDHTGNVGGVITGDLGRLKSGTEGPTFQQGMALQADYTLFAEGARGHLGKSLEEHFKLRSHADVQTYSLGIKELWRVPASQHRPGLVLHTGGWPLTQSVGGGFIYHYGDNLVAAGIIMSMAYRNPWLSPFEEFQRLKTHPAIRTHLSGGTRLAYGARVLANGGPQSVPNLVFPGGALVGDEAGFLDPARLKGVHGALFSGMLAAEAAVEAIVAGRAQDMLSGYPEKMRQSAFFAELQRGRNFKPSLALGQWIGPLLAGIDQKLLRGYAPWTLHHQADHSQLESASTQRPIDYPKPDGVLTFDRASSLFLSNLRYVEDQPCHLRLKAPTVSVDLNLPTYAAPEQRYCPANVYEIVETSEGPRLQINAGNCLHCKACDIKDPTENIEWSPPQGGDGPFYTQM